MNRKELKDICLKYGYKLAKVTRFKNHDRVKVLFPEVIITLNLHKHLEETSKEGILRSILSDDQLKNEGITDVA